MEINFTPFNDNERKLFEKGIIVAIAIMVVIFVIIKVANYLAR